jgi:2-oxoglutarate ferredoxin oxidoreductase subunit alpha
VAEKDDIPQASGEPSFFPVPLHELAESAGGRIMLNTVALGVLAALLDYDINLLNAVLIERFGDAEPGQSNIKAAAAGYDFARKTPGGLSRYKLEPVKRRRHLLINGNEAIAYGALAAGCRFMAAYPMTPSTPILEFLAEKADKFGMHVIQAEDEIAAINMAIGAGFTGARALTATSGSGFCLMVEGLGLAEMTETPVVIIDGQRPGPCVGLPTRTEQGDLQFVLSAHHGEFPRVVLAPGSVEEAFWLTIKAFNLAEKYQTPVIILTDQHLAESCATTEPFDLSKVAIERGDLLSEIESDKLRDSYVRHKVTRSGVSPRALPGLGHALAVTDSDEHDEEGHITESASVRSTMVEKRLSKMIAMSEEVLPPTTNGTGTPSVSLLGWGSSLGAMKEAVDRLNAFGQKAAMMHLSQLWPFPAQAVTQFMSRSEHNVVVESNATGQLAKLIRQETGIQAQSYVRRYDGRPLTPAYILSRLKK